MKKESSLLSVVLSPSEEELYAKMGSWSLTSPIAEEHGADILIFSKNGLCGIQRKHCPTDLITSLYDGRLSRETTLLRDTCTVSFLVVEDKLRYYPDGTVVSGVRDVKYHWTKRSVRKALWEIAVVKGVQVCYTDNLDDTVGFVVDMVEFMESDNHLLMFKRPGCPAQWGIPTEEEKWLWVLQGFEGIGVGLARAIVRSFGTVPLRWDCEYGDLLKVPKIGAGRAGKLWKSLPLSKARTTLTEG